MKSVTIKFTREQAISLGLLICKCGWPENTHFAFGKRVCAHNDKCKGYSEVVRVGRRL